MNDQQRARYENGHFSGMDVITANVPAWANLLNFHHAPCYIFAQQPVFLRECRLITTVKPYTSPVFLEIGTLPSDPSGYRQYFRDLELMGVNLLASCGNITLECYGATFDTDKKGGHALTGRFKITGHISEDVPPVEINVIGRLIVSRGKETHSCLTKSLLVPYFKVPARITMDPCDINEDWFLLPESVNPLFGFFEHTQQPKIAAEASTDLSSSSGRRGRLGHLGSKIGASFRDAIG
jgi:hypothetical protein